MKSRVFIQLLVLMLVVLSMSVPIFAGGQEEKAYKGGKIELAMWKSGQEKPWHDYYTSTMDNYTKNHPNVSFNYFEIPFHEDGQAKINAAQASGTLPDIIVGGVVSLGQGVVAGRWLNLDKYVSNYAEKDKVMESAWNNLTFRGSIYGVGYHWDPRIFVWRKDWFREAGLDPEKAPNSWGDIESFALKLVKRDGEVVVRSGMDVPVSAATNYFSIFARGNGAQLVDEKNEIILNDEPASVEALQFMVDLRDKKVSIDHNHVKATTIPFLNSKGAMSFVTPSTLKAYYDSHSEQVKDIGVKSHIPRKVDKTFAGMQIWYVTTQSKNPDEAWKFIEYLNAKDETWKRYKAVNNIPTRMDIKDEYIADNPDINKALFEASLIGKSLPGVPWGELWTKWTATSIEKAMFKEMSPSEALKWGKDQCNKEREATK